VVPHGNKEIRRRRMQPNLRFAIPVLPFGYVSDGEDLGGFDESSMHDLLVVSSR
jgi:hypothetical protein